MNDISTNKHQAETERRLRALEVEQRATRATVLVFAGAMFSALQDDAFGTGCSDGLKAIQLLTRGYDKETGKVISESDLEAAVAAMANALAMLRPEFRPDLHSSEHRDNYGTA